jgi:hypothetical protein
MKGKLLATHAITTRDFCNSSTPVIQGDRILLSNTGELVLTKGTKDKLEVLSRCQVLQGKTNIQPVLSHRRLLCKNNAGALVCRNVAR